MTAGPTMSHQNELLSQGRCGRCAEQVSRAEVVRRDRCPHCNTELHWGGGGDVLDDLAASRARWRVVGYALVAAASFVAGIIPLLQIVVQLLALFILHIIVLRGGLRWLPPGRRVLARISMKLLGAAIATTAVIVNVSAAPLPGASAFILALTGPLLTAAYVEGSLFILRRRLEWEAAGDRLRPAEWILPVGLVGALLAAVTSAAVLTVGALHLLATADIPTISELSQFLLEVG